jgi:acetyl esterase/lipase
VTVRKFAISFSLAAASLAQKTHIGASDVVKLPSQPPLARIAYGPAPQQFAELRLPAGKGPFPVIAILHGGCYGDYATLSYTAPMATALLKEGWATWNIEYRREQEPGGGWPGTFLDSGNGVDALRAAAGKYPLDLNRVVTIGHSAGGQLALWVAARKRVPSSSEVYMANPLPVSGAVSMAGIVDMRAFVDYGRQPCGERHIRVMGGLPDRWPARYAAVSPAELLPLGIPQVLIWGADDTVVPESLFHDYENRVRAGGENVRIVTLPGEGHHDLCDPGAPGWARITGALRGLLR